MLIVVSVVCYLDVFRWRHLDDYPDFDMLVVQEDDLVKLASFRLMTVSELIEPTLEQANLLRELRKQAKRGPIFPPSYDGRLAAINESLEAILENAKGQKVPDKYKRQYARAVSGIMEAQQACGSLEGAFSWPSFANKDELITCSISETKSAEAKLLNARAFFGGQPKSRGSEQRERALLLGSGSRD